VRYNDHMQCSGKKRILRSLPICKNVLLAFINLLLSFILLLELTNYGHLQNLPKFAWVKRGVTQ